MGPVVEAFARKAPKATITLLMGDEGSLTLDGTRLVRRRRRWGRPLAPGTGVGARLRGRLPVGGLRGCELQETVDTASAVAALKCSMWGDIALVTAREVQEVLAGGPAVRR